MREQGRRGRREEGGGRREEGAGRRREEREEGWIANLGWLLGL